MNVTANTKTSPTASRKSGTADEIAVPRVNADRSHGLRPRWVAMPTSSPPRMEMTAMAASDSPTIVAVSAKPDLTTRLTGSWVTSELPSLPVSMWPQ